MDSSHDVVVIGAGWSGLLAAKYLKAEGLDPVVLEKRGTIGGVWRHDPERVGGVIRSTITTSSRTSTEMSDFPMPSDVPEFPRHSQIMEYLESYCDAFGLWDHIQLDTGVERVERVEGGWRVHTDVGTTYAVERVVVCSGVHQEPADSGRASLEGFEGEVVHSARLHGRFEEMADKRVLLVGTGETASDISVELTRVTPHLTVSSPRGQWFANRVSNFPVSPPSLNDYFSSPLRMLVDPTDSAFATADTVVERYGACGSAVPEWQTDRPYQGQFLNKNAMLVELWRLGQITAKPRIVGCEGGRVQFSDGTEGVFDVVVLCTGFDTVFPFLPAPYDTRRVNEHFKLCLADDPTLAFVGFARPVVGSIPTLAEMQSRCIAALFSGRIALPGDQAATIARDLAYQNKRFDTPRIAGLVDGYLYVFSLAEWLGVRPDYLALLRDDPRAWWTAMVAPYNGAVFWLNDPEHRPWVLERLARPQYVIQHSLMAWAAVLYRNAFPLRRHNVYSERKGFWLRWMVGVLLLPLFGPAAVLLSRRKHWLVQLYGVVLWAVLSPVLLLRLIDGRRRRARMRADYRPADPAALRGGRAKHVVLSDVEEADDRGRTGFPQQPDGLLGGLDIT